ncbi:hypothetical protein [Pseudobacteroides cellulosolvens]|nr:hypothetical protein [Pseudobacteroides cellulosolvens]
MIVVQNYAVFMMNDLSFVELMTIMRNFIEMILRYRNFMKKTIKLART